MADFLRIDEKDNVIITLKEQGSIPKAHKIASQDIVKGADIIKYGMPIGYATTAIAKGDHVHTHNMATNLSGQVEYEYSPVTAPPTGGRVGTADIGTNAILATDSKAFACTSPQKGLQKKVQHAKVQAYRRANGKLGIRNELFVIPTVGCSTATAQQMVQTFLAQQDTSHIDGVRVFPHPYGCSQMGEDHENTRLSLQRIALHPNAGGVLIVGLGCENNQVPAFMEGLEQLAQVHTFGDTVASGSTTESRGLDHRRIKALITQEVDNEIAEGVRLLTEIYEAMRHDKRTEAPLTEITFGLECGGSDGFSGITANVMLGEFSDALVQNNGTTVLTEVPEMFGAETGLMNRAKDEFIFRKIVTMINDFKAYYTSHNQVIYENPSPGNKAGGITTLEEKSLGCCQKSGTSAISGVLPYGDTVTSRGVQLLSAPGNDLVATTALGMAGCQLVLFTTGRGTPFGGFIPTLKISTNTPLAKKKPHWIDFNAGEIASGTSVTELACQFVDYVIQVCNGTHTNNEKNNFREIAIFKSGVTL